MAWKEDAQVTLQHFSKNFIDVLMKPLDKDVEWRFSSFYGSPYIDNRSSRWDCLRQMGCISRIPWCVCEDFNEILYAFEKVEGLPREERRIEYLRDTLRDYGLFDLGYVGSWFAWERGNLPENNICERLDRGVTTELWLTMFPLAKVRHLTFAYSDHYHILLQTEGT